MAHLVQELRDVSYASAARNLRAAHNRIVKAAQKAVLRSSLRSWGVDAKRWVVVIPSSGKAKASERFVEVVNITATLERLLDALAWVREAFPSGHVRVCHPSTSSSGAGRSECDLVVSISGGQEVRVEVCDVVSSNAGQNGKEVQTIRALGNSGTRILVTSEEWGAALLSGQRKTTRWIREKHGALPHKSWVLRLR